MFTAEPTDAERAADALAALDHLAEFHRPGARTFRDHTTPDAVETIDAVRDTFDGEDTEAVLADLWEGRSFRRDRREIVLERLADLADAVDSLSKPRSRYAHAVGMERQYPFGRSRGESAARITDAIETLRDVLTEDEEIEGYGMRAVAEGR
jgi:hypothetical protein